MPRFNEIPLYTAESRPDEQEDIETYLEGISPNSENAYVKEADELGNTVITFGETQETPFGEIPQSIVVSPEGRALLKDSTGLLKQIQKGSGKGKKLGQGTEGNVYELNVSDGYVVKYSYPSIQETIIPTAKNVVFTPQTTHMLTMQKLKQIEGDLPFQVVAPVIATVNISITPKLPSHTDVMSLLSAPEDGARDMWEAIPQEKRDVLKSLLSYTALSQPFTKSRNHLLESIEPRPSGRTEITSIPDEIYGNLQVDLEGLNKVLQETSAEDIDYELLKPYLYVIEVVALLRGVVSSELEE